MWFCESSRFRSLQSKPSFWHQRNNINKPQYINFFLAAVTNCHKIGGLKQYRFIFLYCWRSEVPNGSHLGKIKVLAELTFLCGGQVGGGGRGGAARESTPLNFSAAKAPAARLVASAGLLLALTPLLLPPSSVKDMGPS